MRAARIAAVLAGVVALAVPVGQASADSIQDKQRQASQLAARIEQLQNEAERLAEDYNEAVENLAKADEEVASAKARLTQQEGELSTLRSRMSVFALKSYVFADQSASVAALLDDAALSGQAAGRDGYTALAMGANVDLTDSLNATRDDTATPAGQPRGQAALPAAAHRGGGRQARLGRRGRRTRQPPRWWT